MTGKQLKNSILQWAIQGKLVPQDPNDEPASELLERIRAEKTRLVKKGKIKKDKNESIIYRGEDNSYYEKNLASNVVKCIDDEIPFEIPKQWIWCRLGSIVAVYGGKRIPVGESLSKIDTGHKYIRVSDMKNNSVKTDDIHFISESIYQRIKAYTISKDDIYITVAGTIGSIGEIPAELDGANLTENADKLVFNGLSRHFMMYALMSDLIQNQIRECTTKVGQPKLAIIRIQRLLFALPPINEQNRIADRIELIIPIANKYEKLQLNKNKLNTAIIDELKKSILQEAIQGKLVPQDPSEGTAEVLITQINANKQYLVNQGVLKKSSAIGSTISKGSDGKYYERIEKEVHEITDNIPFEIPESWRWVRFQNIVQINPKNIAEDKTLSAFIPMEKIEANYGSNYSFETIKWGAH